MAFAPSVCSAVAVFVVGSSIEPQISERENSNWRFGVFIAHFPAAHFPVTCARDGDKFFKACVHSHQIRKWVLSTIDLKFEFSRSSIWALMEMPCKTETTDRANAREYD